MGKMKDLAIDLEEIHEEIALEELDGMSNEEIRHLINTGRIKEEDVVWYYRNDDWEFQG